MSDVADVLERAAALLEPRGAWTQGEYALNAEGYSALPHSPHATCWCIMGAIRRAGGYQDDHQAKPAIDAVKRVFPREPSFLHVWNDRKTRTKKQVVAALREAAKLARENADA